TDREGGAVAELAGDGDLAVVGVHTATDDLGAQAGAADLVAHGLAGEELFEDVGGNAASRVGDLDLQARGLLVFLRLGQLRPHVDEAAGGRVGNGVVDQ